MVSAKGALDLDSRRLFTIAAGAAEMIVEVPVALFWKAIRGRKMIARADTLIKVRRVIVFNKNMAGRDDVYGGVGVQCYSDTLKVRRNGDPGKQKEGE
jgi:hypothetical protein